MNAEQKNAEQKNAELMFANLPRIRKLEFRIFYVTTAICNHLFIYKYLIYIFESFAIFNSAFFENFENFRTIFILNFF